MQRRARKNEGNARRDDASTFPEFPSVSPSIPQRFSQRSRADGFTFDDAAKKSLVEVNERFVVEPRKGARDGA